MKNYQESLFTLIIILLLSLGPVISFGQIFGNKDIVTKTFNLEEIKSIEINLSGEFIIDMNGKNEISITSDSNIIPYIGRRVIDGKLELDQIKWINPSDEHKVVIGAPALDKLILDSHSEVVLKNIVNQKLTVLANIGKLKIDGQTNDLQLTCKSAKVDASKLIAQNADINITGWGRVSAYVENKITSTVKEEGSLQLVNEPKELAGDAKKDTEKKETDVTQFQSADFIDFKIKNNSFNRNHFVVVGPKKDGSFFSYGFPMWPGQLKSERWSIGTKIYKKNRMGIRKLLVTITADNAGEVVKLFGEG